MTAMVALQAMVVFQAILPLPLREEVGGRGRHQYCTSLPP
jgi:hypothetical protein